MVVYSPDQHVPDQYHAAQNFKFMDWINPDQFAIGTFAVFEVELQEGVEYVFNGQTSGVWWCHDNNQVDVLIASAWNGQEMDPVTPVIHNAGCNFTIVAEAGNCPWNDEDCDGYFADDVDSSRRDCNDTNPFIRPFQVETWDDNVDTDCNGHVNPPNWRYIAWGIPQGMEVQLVDASVWMNGDFLTYPMPWSSDHYAVDVGNWKAPEEYVVRFRQNAGQQWAWTPWGLNGGCTFNVGNSVITQQVIETYDAGGGPIVSFGADPAKQCHMVKL